MLRRSFSISGGLFYAAPIGAGLSEETFFAVVPFTVLFLLRAFVTRGQLPFGGSSGVMPTVMVHAALASMYISIGYLLGMALGVRATVSLTGWLIVGLIALVLNRLIGEPKKETGSEALMEAALRKLNAFADEAEEQADRPLDVPLAHPTQAEAAALALAYGEMDALPADGAGEVDLRNIVAPLDGEVRPAILLEAFLNRAERTGTRRDRHAALLLASDGALAWQQPGERRMAESFDQIVAAADTATLAHYLRLGEAMLTDFPTTGATFPDVPRLLDISDQIEAAQPDLAEGLVALANRLEELDAEQNNE